MFDAEAFGPNPPVMREDTYPACNGLCAPTTINGQLVNGSCSSSFVENECCRVYGAFKDPDPIQHTGHGSCMVKLDDGHNVVEANEDHNVYRCASAGIPAASATWGTVSALQVDCASR